MLQNIKDNIYAILLAIFFAAIFWVLLFAPVEGQSKPTRYCVTLYNHDGSIRGTYHNITQFRTSEATTNGYHQPPNNVLYLPEYEAYIKCEYVIAPEKD